MRSLHIVPIVTDFSAHLVRAGRGKIGKSRPQRIISWLTRQAFASIVLRPPRSSAITQNSRRTLSKETPMKQPSVYLKMRVLGAIDIIEGRTRHERILKVADMTFLDEEASRGSSLGEPSRPGTTATKTMASLA